MLPKSLLDPLIIDPTITYSTYLGGGGNDYGHSIAVRNGLLYVTGATASTNFPTTSGAYQSRDPPDFDAFVTILNPNLTGASQLIYSTYLGGMDMKKQPPSPWIKMEECT
ncbi:MAG: SBBP repeat-containing protein [Bacteroidia bacterium]